ncbi:MAG: hypothetical protein ACOC8N_04470 [Spirochaetota bacterium]
MKTTCMIMDAHGHLWADECPGGGLKRELSLPPQLEGPGLPEITREDTDMILGRHTARALNL